MILGPGLVTQNATLQHVGQRLALDASTHFAVVRVPSPILADSERCALPDLILSSSTTTSRWKVFFRLT